MSKQRYLVEKQIESDAAHGKPIPKNLDPPEVMLYQSLAALYQRYRSGGITPEQGASEKQVILNSYKRMRADYDQLHEICKLYQMRLKEGYDVKYGNKTDRDDIQRI